MRAPSYFQRVAGVRSGLPYLNPPRALARAGAAVDAWSEEPSFGSAPAPASAPQQQAAPAATGGFDAPPAIQDAVALATAVAPTEAAPAVVTRNVRTIPAAPRGERIETAELPEEAHDVPLREPSPVRTSADTPEEQRHEAGEAATAQRTALTPAVVPHARAAGRAAQHRSAERALAEQEDEQRPLTARTTLSSPPRPRRTEPPAETSQPARAPQAPAPREPESQAQAENATRPEQRSQPRSGRPPAGQSQTEEASSGGVHIGTLEVRVLPPAANTEPVVITVPAAAPAAPLSRGFTSSVGLRQG